ncbi:MAG: host attachment protein [Verrucomicrobiota bacterium]|nr:host attachment protein [Limisphaera sp.]MDW8380494.1 host attachment protein [Verrucomicrobiota bacterium]
MKIPRLVVVTDLGQFRAARLETTPRGTPRLEWLEEVRLEAYPNRVVDKVTDLAGRHASPSQKHWGAPMADAHNLKLETRRRIVKGIVKRITKLMKAHPDLPLWLAAPAEINHLVLEGLPTALRTRVEASLARDLVKAPQRELLAAFPRLRES